MSEEQEHVLGADGQFHVEDEADAMNADAQDPSPRTKGPGGAAGEFGGARTRTRRQTKPR